MQFQQPPLDCLVLLASLARFAFQPAVIPAARYFQYSACLLHRDSLAFQRLDAAMFLLYGFDRMPTDFFRMSMTSSFSPNCLRRRRFSASSSRRRCCSRFCRLACPISMPDAFSQFRSVSMQIPSSLATSTGCRPCSVTSRIVPALNASSYRRGAVPFCPFLFHFCCPFPFQFTTPFSVCQFGYGGKPMLKKSAVHGTTILKWSKESAENCV